MWTNWIFRKPGVWISYLNSVSVKMWMMIISWNTTTGIFDVECMWMIVCRARAGCLHPNSLFFFFEIYFSVALVLIGTIGCLIFSSLSARLCRQRQTKSSSGLVVNGTINCVDGDTDRASCRLLISCLHGFAVAQQWPRDRNFFNHSEFPVSFFAHRHDLDSNMFVHKYVPNRPVEAWWKMKSWWELTQKTRNYRTSMEDQYDWNENLWSPEEMRW